MATVKVFVKANCARCPQAKQAAAALRDEGFTIAEFDVDTAEGLAESAFYSVQATPTIIVEDGREEIIGDFRGEVPPIQTLRDMLAAG